MSRFTSLLSLNSTSGGAFALCLSLASILLVADRLHAAPTAAVQTFEISLPEGEQAVAREDRVFESAIRRILGGDSASQQELSKNLDDGGKMSLVEQQRQDANLKQLNSVNKRQASLKKKYHKLIDDLIDGGESDESRYPAKKDAKRSYPGEPNPAKQHPGKPARIQKRAPAASGASPPDAGSGEKIFILVKKPLTEQQQQEVADPLERSLSFTNKHMQDLANDKYGIREAVRKMRNMGLIMGNIKDNQLGQADEVF